MKYLTARDNQLFLYDEEDVNPILQIDEKALILIQFILRNAYETSIR